MPKLRWNCDRRGCFNRLQRPKIEVFDDCFAGSIAFGDVDGVVERNGFFLFLEFKRPGTPITIGQRILHQRLTGLSRRITTAFVFGDAETMDLHSVAVMQRGVLGAAKACTLAELKQRIAAWFNRADTASL